MKPTTSLRACFAILASFAFALSSFGALVTVSTMEVWNGTNNLHPADVGLSGSGTPADPYVYTITNGMRIASGASIRLSASVDYDLQNDTNHVTFKFLGSNWQIDSGGWIDVGHNSRNVTSRFLCDMGGGSIAGAGKILGMDHSRNAATGINVRFVTITNASAVSLAEVDLHVENINATPPDFRVDASNNVSVSGTITTSYTAAAGDAGSPGACLISAGSIVVSNIDTRVIVGTGHNNGAISLKALNAAGGYSTSYAANAYTNQIVIKGAVTTAGGNNLVGGNITLQSVMLRLDAGASVTKASSGTLTFTVGTTNTSTSTNMLFMNLVGASLTPNYTVTWNGGFSANPVVSSIEVWNGTNNPHAADGVALYGSGSVADPYVYAIPAGLRIAAGGVIRLSSTVVNSPPNTDTNNVTLLFASGNLQMDSGGCIDVGSPDRTVSPTCTINLGGGSITGAGRILGIDSARTPGSGRSVKARSLQIVKALNVSLVDIDLHTEAANGTPTPLHSITAANQVSISGTINTSDLDTGGGTSQGFSILAGNVTVNNMDTRAFRSDKSANNGPITLKALNAAGGYSTAYAGNAYTNQVVVNGTLRTDGVGPGGGNITLQSVVLRLDTGSSLAKATNGVLTAVEGTTNVSVTASQLFMNVSGTLVGPSGQVLNATNTVTWNGTLVGPYFVTSPVVKPDAIVSLDYSLRAQTLSADAVDPQWGTKTFAKVSGPAWLSIASNGSLSGTPGAGDAGTNTWTVSVTAGAMSATGSLQIVAAKLATVSAVEVWNGTNNPHAADGVTLSGSGTPSAPFVYTIPGALRILSGASIRLSGSVDYDLKNDTNNITFRFNGGNLQIDAGGWIDVGHNSRDVMPEFRCDMGGGSVTGGGKILGIDHTRNAGSGVNVRFVTITNATAVSLGEVDMHTENLNTSPPDLKVYATNGVSVTGSILTSCLTGENQAGNCMIYGGSVTVSNVDTRAISGRQSGNIVMRALNASSGWSASAANNAYTNQLVVKGGLRSDGGTVNGNIDLQQVVLRMDTGSSLTKASSGVLTLRVGTTSGSVPASKLFMDVAGTGLTPTYNVVWNGTLVGPYFLTSPLVKADGRAAVDYALKSQTLAADAIDPQWDTKVYAKESGPAWLTVAAGGALSGTPGAGDVGTNNFQVSVTASSLSVTNTLQIVVVSASTPISISTVEYWDGTNNPHATDGVTLNLGSGTEASPAVYTIPTSLTVAAGGVIRMSPATTDDRSIKMKFTSGNMQLDSGAIINVARLTRDGRQVAIFDMGGGSITGAGQIVGLVASANTPRVLFVTNAADVYMKTIDLHVENVNNSGRNMRISATNHIEIGTIDNTDRDVGGGSGSAVTLEASTLTVSNIFTFANRTTGGGGANGGEVMLRALAPPNYSTGNGAANTYGNTLVANGVIQVHTNLDLGNNVTLAAVRMQLGSSFNLIKTANYATEVLVGGLKDPGISQSDMFSNSSSVSLTPTYVISWTNTPTSISVVPSANPVCAGSSVSFTASVIPGSAQPLLGTVQFKTNGVNFGTPVSLTGSNATSASTTLLASGNNAVTAVYNGNTTFASSTSPSLSQVVNAASASNVAYNQAKGLPFKLIESELLTHASGTDGVVLSAVQSPSANGVVITRSEGRIIYNGDLAANDSFTYTVASVSGGCTAVGTVSINAVSTAGASQMGAPVDGVVTITFYGIPNVSYVVQTTTNLAEPWWPVSTNTAGGNGMWVFTDSHATNAQQYYRLTLP